MLATGTQTPRRFLFVQGFTCALDSLKYALKGIFSHRGGLLVQEMADIAPALGLEKLGGVECRFVHDAHFDALSWRPCSYIRIYRIYKICLPGHLCTGTSSRIGCPAQRIYSSNTVYGCDRAIHPQHFKLKKPQRGELASEGGCSDSTASGLEQQAGRGRGRDGHVIMHV